MAKQRYKYIPFGAALHAFKLHRIQNHIQVVAWSVIGVTGRIGGQKNVGMLFLAQMKVIGANRNAVAMHLVNREAAVRIAELFQTLSQRTDCHDDHALAACCQRMHDIPGY